MKGKIVLEEHVSSALNNRLWGSSGEAARHGKPRRVRPPGTPPPDCTCYQWRGEEIPQKNSRISNCKVEYFPRQITTLVVHSYTRSEATQNATSMATDTIPLRHLIKVLT